MNKVQLKFAAQQLSKAEMKNIGGGETPGRLACCTFSGGVYQYYAGLWDPDDYDGNDGFCQSMWPDVWDIYSCDFVAD